MLQLRPRVRHHLSGALAISALLLAGAARASATEEPTATDPAPSAAPAPSGAPALTLQPLPAALSPSLPPLTLTPPQQRPLWRDPVFVSVTEGVTIHFAIMKWNKYVGDADWANITWKSVQHNLQHAWVWDDDHFWVNQFAHPYQGTLAFTAARSAGLGFWPSTLYPFFSSLAWEYSGETLPPAFNDQVTTTVAGISLGEVLLRVSDALWARGDDVGKVSSMLLAPMTVINRGWVGPRPATPMPSLRVLATAGGMSGDPGKDGHWLPPSRVMPFGGVQVVYGVPGDPHLSLSRPFDHFVWETAYGLAADPVSTMRIRGLLAGQRLEPGPDLRGLWGLYLTFSIDTPGPFRTSGSGLGVGTSLHWDLRGGVALEGTAMGTAVLVGAAGKIPSVGGAGRDYRFGPGAEGLLEAELLTPRARAGITVRPYYLRGVGAGAGNEERLDLAAHASVRILGSHGAGVEAIRLLRRAQDVGGLPTTDDATVLRAYYAYDLR